MKADMKYVLFHKKIIGDNKMGIFRKKNENGEKVARDWSALLPLVVILMFISAVVGIIASSLNISSSNKAKQIDSYVASTVTFSVIGTGSYKDENQTTTVFELYVPIERSAEVTNVFKETNEWDKVQEGGYYVYSSSITFSDIAKMKNFAEEENLEYSIKMVRNNREASIVYAYDAAYDEALQKANLIAENTGKTWRITKVEEIASDYNDYIGETTSVIRMTFAVSNK